MGESRYTSGSKAFCQKEGILCHGVFNWKTENILFSASNPFREIASSTYKMGPRSEYEWKLKLLLTNPRQLHIIALKNVKYAEGKCIYFDGENKSIASEDFTLGADDSKVRTVVPAEAFALDRNALNVTVEVTVLHDTSSSFIHFAEIPCNQKPVGFDSYLCSLWNNEKFADFKVRVGSTVLRTHRIVLAANSPFFARLFEGDTEEATKGELEVNDFDEDVVREFLRFAYTHAPPEFPSWQLACRVFEIARKYETTDLQEVCKSFLIDVLDARNVEEFVKTEQSDDEVKLEVLSHIKSHPPLSQQAIPLYGLRKVLDYTLKCTWDLIRVFDIPRN